MRRGYHSKGQCAFWWPYSPQQQQSTWLLLHFASGWPSRSTCPWVVCGTSSCQKIWRLLTSSRVFPDWKGWDGGIQVQSQRFTEKASHRNQASSVSLPLFFSPWSPESGWNSTTLFCSKSLSRSSASGMGHANRWLFKAEAEVNPPTFLPPFLAIGGQPVCRNLRVLRQRRAGEPNKRKVRGRHTAKPPWIEHRLSGSFLWSEDFLPCLTLPRVRQPLSPKTQSLENKMQSPCKAPICSPLLGRHLPLTLSRVSAGARSHRVLLGQVPQTAAEALTASGQHPRWCLPNTCLLGLCARHFLRPEVLHHSRGLGLYTVPTEKGRQLADSQTISNFKQRVTNTNARTKQTDRPTNKQTNKQTNKHRQTDKQTNNKTNYKQTNKKANKHKWTNKQTNKQTTCTHFQASNGGFLAWLRLGFTLLYTAFLFAKNIATYLLRNFEIVNCKY